MKRSKEIIIGSARDSQVSLELTGMSKEAFIIKEKDEEIYITGNSPRGILYGVYKFLEAFINFRCFTKDCEKYDSIDNLSIDKDFSLIQDFTFEYREVYFTDAFNGDFAAKNMQEYRRKESAGYCRLVPFLPASIRFCCSISGK